MMMTVRPPPRNKNKILLKITDSKYIFAKMSLRDKGMFTLTCLEVLATKRKKVSLRKEIGKIKGWGE